MDAEIEQIKNEVAAAALGGAADLRKPIGGV
jgi:hypothetical protein